MASKGRERRGGRRRGRKREGGEGERGGGEGRGFKRRLQRGGGDLRGREGGRGGRGEEGRGFKGELSEGGFEGRGGEGRRGRLLRGEVGGSEEGLREGGVEGSAKPPPPLSPLLSPEKEGGAWTLPSVVTALNDAPVRFLLANRKPSQWYTSCFILFSWKEKKRNLLVFFEMCELLCFEYF